MRNENSQVPQHSTRDFAFVEWKSERYRLPGLYNSAESHFEYQEFIRKNVTIPKVAQPSSHSSIGEITVQFLDWAMGYYPPRRNEHRHGEYNNLRGAVRPFAETYGGTPAERFGPKLLKAYRATLVDKGLSRDYINGQIRRIRQMFRWAASEERVSASVYEALKTVDGLRKGRSEAKEKASVKPVDWEDVEIVLPHLSDVVGSMVTLQWYTGVRPQCVVNAMPNEIEQADSQLWIWRPVSKMEHKDQDLIVPLGKRSQSMILPFLNRDDGTYLFNPREAVRTKKNRVHPGVACAASR